MKRIISVLALVFLASQIANAKLVVLSDKTKSELSKISVNTFKTLVCGLECQDKLKTNEFLEIKTKYQSGETVNNMYQLNKKFNQDNTDYDYTEFNLEKSFCLWASNYLSQIFKNDYLKTLITHDRVDEKYWHVYLIKKDYFAKGEHLIIDSTIRQFFPKKHWNKVPLIFVGSAEQAYELFAYANQKDMFKRYINTKTYQ